jgi:hypothetical protein
MNSKAFNLIIELLLVLFFFSIFFLFFPFQNNLMTEKLLELNVLQKEHDLLKVWLSNFNELNLNEMLSDALFVFPEKTIEISFDEEKILFKGKTKNKAIISEVFFYDAQLKKHIITLKVFLE